MKLIKVRFCNDEKLNFMRMSKELGLHGNSLNYIDKNKNEVYKIRIEKIQSIMVN